MQCYSLVSLYILITLKAVVLPKFQLIINVRM